MGGKMEKSGWKIIAVVFILLFLAETLFIIWGYHLVVNEEKKTMSCYYEVCKDYPDARYETQRSLCTCYDYDVLGQLMPVEYKMMD